MMTEILPALHIRLSNAEVLFLEALLGIRPAPAEAAEQRELPPDVWAAQYATARDALRARSLISADFAQAQLVVDPLIAAALATCAQTPQTLVITHAAPGIHNVTVALYMQPALAVAHRQGEPGLHDLTIFFDQAHIGTYLRAEVAPDGTFAPPSPETTLQSAAIQQALTTATRDGADAAAAVLRAGGADAALAGALAAAMARPTLLTTVIATTAAPGQPVRGWVQLVADDTLWQITPDGPTQTTRVRVVDPQTLAAAMDALVATLEPTP